MNLTNHKQLKQKSGVLYLVATPIGNLADISFRAIQTLKSVDLILCEHIKTSQKLFHHYQITTKKLNFHQHNEKKMAENCIEKLMQGKNIGLISDAGTPGINDPGAFLVNLAHQNNIKISVIPGASALTSAISASGMSGEFCFYGFIPNKKIARFNLLTQVIENKTNSIFFIGKKRLEDTLEQIYTINPNLNILIAKEISKIYETISKQKIGDILAWIKQDEQRVNGEFVLILEKQKVDQNTDEKAKIELVKILKLLKNEKISANQSAKIASKMTGFSKNDCYQQFIQLNN